MSDFDAARKRLEEAPPWHAEDVCLLLDEIKRLREALGEASMSMETIADAAGSRDGLLLEMSQVRGYARNRAAVARAALRGEKEK